MGTSRTRDGECTVPYTNEHDPIAQLAHDLDYQAVTLVIRLRCGGHTYIL